MNHDNGKLHRGTVDSPEINTTGLSMAFGEDWRSWRLCCEGGRKQSIRKLELKPAAEPTGRLVGFLGGWVSVHQMPPAPGDRWKA